LALSYGWDLSWLSSLSLKSMMFLSLYITICFKAAIYCKYVWSLSLLIPLSEFPIWPNKTFLSFYIVSIILTSSIILFLSRWLVSCRTRSYCFETDFDSLDSGDKFGLATRSEILALLPSLIGVSKFYFTVIFDLNLFCSVEDDFSL
jgi:hypothetical protein